MLDFTLDWKWVGIGAALIIVLAFIFGIISSIGSYFGVLIAGIILCYQVNGDFKNGGVHGVTAGFLGGIITGVILILGLGILGSTTNIGLGVGLTVGALYAMVYVVVYAVLGLVGGAIGAEIKGRM